MIPRANKKLHPLDLACLHAEMEARCRRNEARALFLVGCLFILLGLVGMAWLL